VQAQAPDGLTATDVRIIPITWVVRTETDPFSMSEVIQDELLNASGGLPVSRVRSMDQVIGQSTARSDFNTIVLAVFAGAALLLAAIGVYGMMSYSVQQRRREIGVRMALGAGPERVRKEVVFHGMRVSLMGLSLGVVAAMGLTRFLSGLVYGTTTSNPVIIMVVSLLLFLTVLLASYVPSRQATRVNPVEALRHE
jgi:ABC-type antimicrobial peptide transport system permease subunit